MWSKPAVQAVVLPAHASVSFGQISNCADTADRITATGSYFVIARRGGTTNDYRLDFTIGSTNISASSGAVSFTVSGISLTAL